MIVRHARGLLARVQEFFDGLVAAAGLSLNIPKTVLVPLEPISEECRARIGALLSLEAPGWQGMQLDCCAKYLGLFVGSGHSSRSWAAPLGKALARAEEWGRRGLGMFLTAEALRVYAYSVLHYVGQLEPPPAELLTFEASVVTKAFPGPFGWLTPQAARGLRGLGGPAELVDLEAVWCASKARVSRWEGGVGLRVEERAAALRALQCHDGVPVARSAWFDSLRGESFLMNLSAAAGRARDLRRAHPAAWWRRRAGWQRRLRVAPWAS